MPLPALAFAKLPDDPAPLASTLPASAGVAQLLDAEARSLVLAAPANLRRWTLANLGLGGPPRPGRRPQTSLRGVASALGWARTAGPFEQRLLYERLMAPLVPIARRRDLEAPVFLHLDAGERFPRLGIRSAADGAAGLYGPFVDRRRAEAAREALHRRFPLRPCDYTFEPDPSLELGLACFFAQVRSCAAPCLARIGEGDYRALAGRAALHLSRPHLREEDDALPPTVAAVADRRALVVDRGGRDVGLYPVREGRVLDDAAVRVAATALEGALAELDWSAEATGDDWPWLLAWLRSARRRRAWVEVEDPADREAILSHVRIALSAHAGR
jgi:hypothetical protein